MHSIQKRDRVFRIPSGDTSPALQFQEGIFDEVSQADKDIYCNDAEVCDFFEAGCQALLQPIGGVKATRRYHIPYPPKDAQPFFP